MLKRLALTILSLSLLTSCGFKLRGSFELPQSLSQISIKGGDRDLVDQLAERLEQSGSIVVAVDSGAPTVNITLSDFLKETRTTNADGLATGYDYEYVVDFDITDGQGGSLQPTATITQRRTLNFDPNEVLQAEEEEEFLRSSMEEEIVLQLLRRLSRL